MIYLFDLDQFHKNGPNRKQIKYLFLIDHQVIYWKHVYRNPVVIERSDGSISGNLSEY